MPPNDIIRLNETFIHFLFKRFSVSRIFDHAHDVKIANQNICAVPAATFVSILIGRLLRQESKQGYICRNQG